LADLLDTCPAPEASALKNPPALYWPLTLIALLGLVCQPDTATAQHQQRTADSEHKSGQGNRRSGGLANEIGFLGITGALFSNARWILNDSYWKQGMFGGNGGFIAGRYDPNDFMDVNGYGLPCNISTDQKYNHISMHI
jgi:hypothetical protein